MSVGTLGILRATRLDRTEQLLLMNPICPARGKGQQKATVPAAASDCRRPGYSAVPGLGASVADHFSSIRPNRQIANATSHAATNRATMP
jgi:hypothetical protein